MSIINKNLSIAAGLCLLAAVLIFVFCELISGGSGNENGPGAVWWFFAFFGIPSAFAGVALFLIGIFYELVKGKSVKISGKSYSLGSVLMLGLLMCVLIFYIALGLL